MSLDKPVLLVGRENMNRSVDGDVVVVEIFPKEEWKAPGEEVIDQDGKRRHRDLGLAHAKSRCETTMSRTKRGLEVSPRERTERRLSSARTSRMRRNGNLGTYCRPGRSSASSRGTGERELNDICLGGPADVKLRLSS